MVIKFACPNGHPLSAGDELAGKPGKCPQCQAMFLVPESPGAPASGGAAAAKSGGTIAFLCPNGHKLTGPRSLQGKAGQCPHCGSKFRIPSYETPAGGAKAEEEEIPVGEMVEHDEGDDLTGIEDVEVVEEEVVDDAVEVDAEYHESPPPPPSENVHPLAYLCRRLWRPGECRIEITYAEGKTLTAELFSPELSELDYGVFGHKDENGKFTVTAIPWESVQKLAVCELGELPEDVFL